MAAVQICPALLCQGFLVFNLDEMDRSREVWALKGRIHHGMVNKQLGTGGSDYSYSG